MTSHQTEASSFVEESETQRLAREMAERMLAREHLDRHCNPDYVDPHRLQVDWEINYENAKAERRERQYQAWRRHQKGK